MSRPVFEEEFTPVALVDQNILILPDKKFYKVKRIKPIYDLKIAFSSLSSGGSAEYGPDSDQVKKLKGEPGQLMHYRFKLIGDYELEIWQPASSNLAATKFASTRITKDTPEHMAEFFILEENTPKFKLYNTTGGTINKPVLIARGYRYEIEPLDITYEEVKKAEEEGRPTIKYTVVDVYKAYARR